MESDSVYLCDNQDWMWGATRLEDPHWSQKIYFWIFIWRWCSFRKFCAILYRKYVEFIGYLFSQSVERNYEVYSFVLTSMFVGPSLDAKNLENANNTNN